jgi:predicted Fe-Mo cluster-binding NifX family protein
VKKLSKNKGENEVVVMTVLMEDQDFAKFEKGESFTIVEMNVAGEILHINLKRKLKKKSKPKPEAKPETAAQAIVA